MSMMSTTTYDVILKFAVESDSTLSAEKRLRDVMIPLITPAAVATGNRYPHPVICRAETSPGSAAQPVEANKRFISYISLDINNDSITPYNWDSQLSWLKTVARSATAQGIDLVSWECFPSFSGA